MNFFAASTQNYLFDEYDRSSQFRRMARRSSRESLIEAGLQVFQLRGFSGCGVQDITSLAGVPKGSFYNHFESKEALALEVLGQFWARGATRREILADATLDPIERLRKHFQALSAAVIGHEFRRGCLIGNFSSELPAWSEPVRERLRGLYDEWVAAIGACVSEVEAAGCLRCSQPASEVAAFLINAWEGAVLKSKVDQSRVPLDQFERVVFSTVFK